MYERQDWKKALNGLRKQAEVVGAALPEDMGREIDAFSTEMVTDSQMYHDLRAKAGKLAKALLMGDMEMILSILVSTLYMGVLLGRHADTQVVQGKVN